MVGGGYFVEVTKRGYLIKKAEYNRTNNKRVGVKVKAFQDSIIDDMVANPDRYEVPLDSVLYAGIESALKPQVYNNYKALLDSPYIKNDSVQEMLILTKANKDIARIAEAELAQMKSNLNYVENVLNKYEVLNSEYKKAISEVSNRKKAIDMATNIALERDNPVFSSNRRYHDLDFWTENLLRENRMTSSYESMQEINRVAEENGDDVVYAKKRWVWTGLGKTTRHMGMTEHPVIDFDDFFEVVNDNTGEASFMLYPCDPSGDPSNSIICYCELETFDDSNQVIV